MSEPGPREKLESLYGEWAHGDYSRSDLFDPGVVTRFVGSWAEGDRALEGIEAVRAGFRDWLAAWERPFVLEAEEIIEAGQRFLVLVRWSGKGKGSGAELNAEGAHIWEFRDGLIVRFDVYRDREQARAALEADAG